MSKERDKIAQELRQVRDEVRDRFRPDPAEASSSPLTRTPRPKATPAGNGVPEPMPEPPDATAVNAAWRAEALPPRGPLGVVFRLLERIFRPGLEAQRAFNARQVQLDNELLAHVAERWDATHRHYDRILGDLGRRLDEADERHAILEGELTEHVQDLVRRIDLVLADASRGRAALELALDDVRARLTRLESARRRRE